MPLRLIPITVKRSILSRPVLRSGIKRAMQDTVTEGVRLMATYPPAVSGSRYKRTGTLMRSWSGKVTQTGDRTEGIIGSNGNIAPYNRDVQGPEGEQDAFFRGRGWTGVEDLVQQVDRQLGPRIQAEIDKAAHA